MSNDKNNLSVVDTTSITHLINELRNLDTKIIKDLSGANGIIVRLEETITRLSSTKNLKEAIIQQNERIKIDAEYAQKEVSENLKKLEEIRDQFQDFESKNKQLIEKQSQKIENLNHNLELRAEIWINQFQENLNSLKNELEIQISKKLKDVDLKRFENANQNVKDAIKNFDIFHQKMEKSYLKNNILTGIISFLGGGTVIGSLVYFFLR